MGHGRPPVEQALILLAFAYPERTDVQLAELSIGQRDTLLLDLMDRTFGSTLEGFVECSQCSESLEFPLDTADVRVQAGAHEVAQEHELKLKGFRLKFRLPNSTDLIALEGLADLAAAHDRLLERCLLQATRHDEPVSAGDLPQDVVTRVIDRIAECDPQADVMLDVRCPACGVEMSMPFDVVSFTWSRISELAMRLFREVHALARTYGWHEAEILALSARRRQLYLEIVWG